MKATLIFKEISEKKIECPVAGRSAIELFPKIFEKIRSMRCECSIVEKDIANEYNKWCVRHTSINSEIPEEINNAWDTKCGYAVPYSFMYRQSLKKMNNF